MSKCGSYNCTLQGMTSSKNDGFSLTSGDFPTLGSGKATFEKNAELKGFMLSYFVSYFLVVNLSLWFKVWSLPKMVWEWLLYFFGVFSSELSLHEKT